MVNSSLLLISAEPRGNRRIMLPAQTAQAEQSVPCPPCREPICIPFLASHLRVSTKQFPKPAALLHKKLQAWRGCEAQALRCFCCREHDRRGRPSLHEQAFVPLHRAPATWATPSTVSE